MQWVFESIHVHVIRLPNDNNYQSENELELGGLLSILEI